MTNLLLPRTLFECFKGRWAIQRQVVHRSSLEGSYEATGEGVFSIEGPHKLSYHEDVNMRHRQTGLLFESSQSYQYRYDAPMDTLVKCFSDGRPFYPFDIQGTEAFGNHQCEEDAYKAHYVFQTSREFSLTYVVTGPGKDYTSVSRYMKSN